MASVLLQKEGENGRLTWEPQARHMYNSTGDYVITVFAANTVSTKSQQFNIKVYGEIFFLLTIPDQIK